MINKIKHYYSRAKRTVLLAQDNLTKKWYHLFSVFELLPTDIPDYNIPPDDWHNNIIRSNLSSGSDIYSIYLMVNDFDDVEDVISRFNNPLQNNIFEGEENFFFNDNFVKEPSGSSPLVLPSNIYNEDGLSDILPKRKSGLYVWTQIDSNRVVQNLFNQTDLKRELKAISQLTLDWLGFDIAFKSEHLGNIYLSVPNPYFRDIDISLSNNPIGIFYRIKFRKGITEDLRLRIIDKHGDNIALDKTFDLNSNYGLLELPHEPHIIQVNIYNSNQDLIALNNPSTFIKSIEIGMSMKQADFHVTVNSDSGKNEFVVEKYSKQRPSLIGTRTEFNAPNYFKDAEVKRKFIFNEKNKEFIFFSGGKSEQEKSELKKSAKEIIREIINKSKDTCYLCDPYFNINDLINYAFYITNTGVELRILNCKEFIDKETAKELSEGINEYNKKPFQKIECKVLKGNSVLHDRFIISDKNVWYLGSSFSEFGNRATCIGKVPESSNIKILEQIERWYFNNGDNYTQSIEDYIKD